MYNGLSQVYCIKLEGRIHLYTKGYYWPPATTNIIPFLHKLILDHDIIFYF